MFKQRLLTTLVLVPLVLLLIYFGHLWLVSAVVLLLLMALGWEWLQLIPVNRVFSKLGFIAVMLLLLWPSIRWQHEALLCAALVWALILMAVVTYPSSQLVWGRPLIVAFVGWLVLPLFATTLVALYKLPQGKDLLLYLLCLVWATDIGAYLAGKQWGRHKLIPRVSPGKTMEGTMGGLVLALLVALIGYYYFQPICWVLWCGIAIYTILVSMLGDLLISMLKRRSQLKDTGQIFPGHGGVLDRLDSLIAALPFFYWGLQGLILKF